MRRIISTAILVGVIIGCTPSPEDAATLVQAKLDAEFVVGSSKEEVERLLEQMGWPYEWDRHKSLYITRNPEEDANPQVRNQVYLHFDENQRYAHYELKLWRSN